MQARIKKIMQGDEDVGKVAAAVPVIICIFAPFFLHVPLCLCLSLCCSLPLSVCLDVIVWLLILLCS